MNKLHRGLNQIVTVVLVGCGPSDWVERLSIRIRGYSYVYATDIELPNGYYQFKECVKFAPDEDEYADLNTLLGHKNAPTP